MVTIQSTTSQSRRTFINPPSLSSSFSRILDTGLSWPGTGLQRSSALLVSYYCGRLFGWRKMTTSPVVWLMGAIWPVTSRTSFRKFTRTRPEEPLDPSVILSLFSDNSLLHTESRKILLRRNRGFATSRLSLHMATIPLHRYVIY